MKNNYMLVDVSQDCSSDLVICDKTGFNSDGFKEETSSDTERYKLSDVIIFTVLEHKKSTESKIVHSTFREITPEEIENYNYDYLKILGENIVKIDKDGYYIIYYLAIPKVISLIGQNNYTADIEGNIYDEDGNEVTLADIEFCESNIMYYIDKLFSISNLRKEFTKYIQESMFSNKNGILSTTKSICCSKNKEMNYELVGSSLSTIRYLIEDCKFEEAELLVELLSNCDDVYLNNSSIEYTSTGCGCGK